MEQGEGPGGGEFEAIISLFDLYWFRHLIFFSHPPQSSSLPQPPALPDPQTLPVLPVPQLIDRQRRTRSDETISKFLPRTPVKPPCLQTILSGKESLSHQTQFSQPYSADMDARRRKKKQPQNRMSRSMSELELEELKGLMDLGFEFSENEVERDPRIADIVPGLRKRRISEGGDQLKVARRPYLSEAWRVRDEEERRRVLRDWRVLANGDESEVKEQLRRWAHVVASTVL